MKVRQRERRQKEKEKNRRAKQARISEKERERDDFEGPMIFWNSYNVSLCSSTNVVQKQKSFFSPISFISFQILFLFTFCVFFRLFFWAFPVRIKMCVCGSVRVLVLLNGYLFFLTNLSALYASSS